MIPIGLDAGGRHMEADIVAVEGGESLRRSLGQTIDVQQLIAFIETSANTLE